MPSTPCVFYAIVYSLHVIYCIHHLQAEVVKQKAAPNLSLKLQLKDLYERFPELEQPLVNETLVRNK